MSWTYTIGLQNSGLGAYLSLQVGGVGSEGEYEEPYASHATSDSNVSDLASALLNAMQSHYPNTDDSQGNSGWTVSVIRADHTAVT